MNQKGFAVNYLIIGLIILALISGAYYFGKITNKPTISSQQQTTQTPFTDETPNWKTYTSQEVNYSFKYPSDWIYQGKSEGCGPVFWMPNTNNQIWLTVCGPYINPDETPEEIAKRSIGKNDILISRENIVMNGYEAIRQERKVSDGKFNLEIFVGDVSFKNFSKGTLGIYFYIYDMSKEKEARQAFDKIISTFKFIDQLTVSPTKIITLDNSVSLKDIKYTLPKGWKAVMNDGLFISPDQGGGFLSVKSYEYPGNIDSKKYYCQLSKVCIEGTTYYEEKKIGNISGYRALALDNSGGGPDYFGFKGNEFYIISTFTPPFPNEFETHFQEVLNSLVF